MREEELKFSVHGSFELPELSSCLPDGVRVVEAGRRELRATYYDTADLRLARTGITLRYRTGEDGAPWHLKLPTAAAGVRTELAAEGAPGNVPGELATLVTAWVRAAELEPAATLHTDRDTWLFTTDDGSTLAELVDDTVSIVDGKKVVSRFREVEIEYGDADRELAEAVVAAVGARLVEGGAVGGDFVPKVMRAFGGRATEAPDVRIPARPGRLASAGDVVRFALRSTVRRMLEFDVRVRRGEDDAVHQMRVCCRRLRSDLRTYSPLVDHAWAERLRGELRWLAAALGGPRDAEVLRERLHKTAHTDPLAPLDATSVEMIDVELAAREDAALAALTAALESPRYVALLDLLVDAAQNPSLTPLAEHPAAYTLPGQVAAAWRKLERPAGRLRAGDPDDTWHATRIRAKRARYAAEAAAPALGKVCTQLAKACASVQTVLGEHQDAATAAEEWLDVARTHSTDTNLVLTCGRLAERERAAVRAARASFADVWKRATRPKLTEWLPE